MTALGGHPWTDGRKAAGNETAGANSGMMLLRTACLAGRAQIAWASGQLQFNERRERMNAILLASIGVVILLVGGGIGYWAGRSGVGGSKAKLEKAEADLEDYKRSVTEHFGQTAEHFQAIGKQYRELYEHMASGAQSLCEPDEAGKQLLFAPGTEAAASGVEEAPVESVVEAEAKPPADYAEEPVAEEVPEVVEATEEPVLEQEAKKSDDAEDSVAELAEGSVAEAANDPQTEGSAEVRERTLH